MKRNDLNRLIRIAAHEMLANAIERQHPCNVEGLTALQSLQHQLERTIPYLEYLSTHRSELPYDDDVLPG